MLIELIRRTRKGAARLVRRSQQVFSGPRIDEVMILGALRSLAAKAPHILLVHSSLSACGQITGGAGTVLRALRAWSDGGTLLMPTHTYCYPSADMEAAVYNPDRSPSVVGAITESFRKQAGVKRSLHPTHSLAGEGPRVESLLSGHETCDTPCGPGTPYQRLVMEDAAVLMFGASMESYTLFHTAEDAADVPYLYLPQKVKVRLLEASGTERSIGMWRQDMSIARSFRSMDGWLEDRGLLRRSSLGKGELLLIPHARDAHDAVVGELRRNSYALTAAGSAAP